MFVLDFPVLLQCVLNYSQSQISAISFCTYKAVAARNSIPFHIRSYTSYAFFGMSAHSLRVISPISDFWNSPTFILSGLWLQNSYLNPLNYKICTQIQHRACLPQKNSQRERNVIIVWLAWLRATHHLQTSGVNVTGCVYSCKTTTF